MTIVSHMHQFVYLKTHKTASTSVEMLLEPLCRPPGWNVVKPTREAHSSYGIVGRRHGGKAIPFRLFNWQDHMSASQCRRALGRKKWNTYAKIATVRNPFDRMLSSYFWRNKHIDPNQEDSAAVITGFRNFIANANWNDDTDIVTLNGKFVIDHAIRYEKLEEDLTKLIADLDLPISVDELPQSNTSGNKERAIPIEHFFDNATTKIVRERQAWVFDNFDYPPEPISTPSQSEVHS